MGKTVINWEGQIRELPAGIEVEQIVLGSAMQDKSIRIELLEKLRVNNFYHDLHKNIYQAIKSLEVNGDPVDLVTVSDWVSKNAKQNYDPYLISKAAEKYTSQIDYHCKIILQFYLQREIIKIGSKVVTDSYENKEDVFDVIEYLHVQLDKISKAIDKKDNNIYSQMEQAQAERDEAIRARKGGGISGVPSGFKDFDRKTNGFKAPDLVIIAARPAMGKTALFLTIVMNACFYANKKVKVFSLEMSAIQLINRLVSMISGIDLSRITNGDLETKDQHKISEAEGVINDNLVIDDTPGITITEFKRKSRRAKEKDNVDMIVIDYLQLMNGDGKSNNREGEISKISRNCKLIAKDLNIPIIALSQLSRAVESRADKEPKLSDLRESGSIEQDADMVIFLYRPKYYGIEEYPDGEPTRNNAHLIISKHRNGPLGLVIVLFHEKQTLFLDKTESNQLMIDERKGITKYFDDLPF